MKSRSISMGLAWAGSVALTAGTLHGDPVGPVVTGKGDGGKVLKQALVTNEVTGEWPAGVPTLQVLLMDPSETVRWEVCSEVVDRLRAGAGGKEERQSYAGDLAGRLQDDSNLIRRNVRKWLAELEPGDFGEIAKLEIERAYAAKPGKELMLLGGLADVAAVKEEARGLVFTPGVEPPAGRFYGTLEWAAALVNARDGDKANLNKVLQAVAREKNEITRVSLLLDELCYVPCPEVAEVLREVLDSDERLEAVKATVPGIKKAQFAAVALAGLLEGFPLVKEDHNYTEEELELCRTWMAGQTTWVFK